MTYEELVETAAKQLLGPGQSWGSISPSHRRILCRKADAALSAIREAGVRLMPAEATEEMRGAGGETLEKACLPDDMDTLAWHIYTAMRDAGEIKPEGGE